MSRVSTIVRLSCMYEVVFCEEDHVLPDMRFALFPASKSKPATIIIRHHPPAHAYLSHRQQIKHLFFFPEYPGFDFNYSYLDYIARFPEHRISPGLDYFKLLLAGINARGL